MGRRVNLRKKGQPWGGAQRVTKTTKKKKKKKNPKKNKSKTSQHPSMLTGGERKMGSIRTFRGIETGMWVKELSWGEGSEIKDIGGEGVEINLEGGGVQ